MKALQMLVLLTYIMTVLDVNMILLHVKVLVQALPWLQALQMVQVTLTLIHGLLLITVHWQTITLIFITVLFFSKVQRTKHWMKLILLLIMYITSL